MSDNSFDKQSDKQSDIKLSIKWKLIALMTILIIGIISILTWFEISSQKDMMEEELGKRIVLMKENLTERAKTYVSNLSQQVEKDIAVYNFSGVAESVKNTSNNPDVKYALLINFSGAVTFNSNNFVLPSSQEFRDKNKDALSKENTTIKEYEEAGESVIEIITPVKISTTPWGALRIVYTLAHLKKEIETSKQQIQYEIRKMIIKSLLMSLLFIGISFVIVLVVAMRFTNPLIQLANFAINLSKSNFSDPSDMPYISYIAKDELGVLTEAFGLMSKEIRELLQESRNYAAELKKYSDHLEELVKERTADLAAANEQFYHAKEAAEAANKSKSHFLANMSHELRTPLNAILGFSQLMLRDKNLISDNKENLETIVRSGEHLLTMINQVLDLSKIEAGRMSLNEQGFDLHRMLNDMEDMFSLRTQEKKLRLIFEQTTDVPQYIKADEVRLRQVIINLLSNSIKFTQEGGIALRVSAEHISEQNIQHTCILHFEVEDTGLGMDEKELHNIFDAFVQSETGKTSGEGTGLGLAISQQFVKLMGGEMRVNSKKDKGSIFTFTVKGSLTDRVDDFSTCRSLHRVIGLVPNQQIYRILVVDDKWDNRHLLLKLLANLGFEVREAENGQQTIEVWESWEPHLIWMDMRMPVMDGYEATRRIKSTIKGQATAIIALTASAFDEDRKLVLSAGCDDFVRKPFRESEIFEMMEKHIGVRFLYEEYQTVCHKNIEQSELGSEAAFSYISQEILSELEDAAVRADMNRIEEIIDEIGKFDKNMSDLLKSMADEFEYGKILNLIRKT